MTKTINGKKSKVFLPPPSQRPSLSSMQRERARLPITVRLAILGVCAGWLFQDTFQARLLPYGPPQHWGQRPSYGKLDLSNDSLMLKHGKLSKIYERSKENGEEMLLKGPETIIFDNKSPTATMYTLTEEANLVELSDIQPQKDDQQAMVATTKLIARLGNGRPLGGCFTPDDSTLYIADAILGLTRIQNPTNPTSKVEIVATTAIDNDTGKLTKIIFADDVVVGPVTGNVYFTEASEILPERNIDTGVWDVMYPSKIELLSGKRSGRLLMYNPTTDETVVLSKGLLFGNGISIDQINEEYVIFAETYSIRIGKYYLTGDKAGTLEYIVDGSPLPAYLDGVDCAKKTLPSSDDPNTRYCYAALPSNVVAASKILYKVPHPFDMFFRMLLMMLPKSLLPKVGPYGGVAVIDPETGTVVDILQDPKGTDIMYIMGATVQDDKLYLGSLYNKFVGVYDLTK